MPIISKDVEQWSLVHYQIESIIVQRPEKLFRIFFKINHTSTLEGLPQRLSGKESTHNVGDAGEVGLIPGLGRCPGGRNGKPL